MNNNNTWIWWLIGAIVLIVGGYLVWQNTSSAPANTTDANGAAMTANTNGQTPTDVNDAGPDANTAVEATVSTGATATGAPMSATVTYNGKSFSPATVTIAKGGTVTFMSTAGSMWVASDPHPTHTSYDGTSRSAHCAPGYAGAAPFDQCAPGATFSMVFNKAGTFGYHNHMVDAIAGTIIVQ
ncbi:MAG: hypothetical protein JWM46_137 [Candidatus Kaiserbacteria bacterium]|nr:hypothetical protein [Candidatus Kaiserbacteria bacterium]